MSWHCADIDDWLDEGCPVELSAAAEEHVRACGRCRAALAAARAVERALALPPRAAAAPAEFTDGVMRRVRAAGDGAGAIRIDLTSWWLRLASDPLPMILCGLGVLLVASAPMAWSLAAHAVPRVLAVLDLLGQWWVAKAAVAQAWPRGLPPSMRPLTLSLVLAPALLWLSRYLARWSERTVARPRLVRAR